MSFLLNSSSPRATSAAISAAESVGVAGIVDGVGAVTGGPASDPTGGGCVGTAGNG